MIHVLRLGLGNVRAVSAFAVVSISKFRLLLQMSSHSMWLQQEFGCLQKFSDLFGNVQIHSMFMSSSKIPELRVNIPDHP